MTPNVAATLTFTLKPAKAQKMPLNPKHGWLLIYTYSWAKEKSILGFIQALWIYRFTKSHVRKGSGCEFAF